MKNRLLVLLVVLALVAVSVNFASAQGDAIKVVTLGETNVYAAASADAEVASTLAVSSVVEVVGVSGDFFEVDGGFVMASDVAVMNLAALAPHVIVSTGTTGKTALFVAPNVSSDIVSTVADGVVATLLAADGQLAFVETADGLMGWSVVSAWEVAPEGFAPALISLGSTDQVGVFAEGNIFSDIAGTLTEGDAVYVYSDTGEDLVQIMLGDGSLGFVRGSYLNVLPTVWVDAADGPRGNSTPALFSKPDFGGDILASVDAGEALVYLGDVDDFWAEVFHPAVGVGYILQDNMGAPYTVGTVQVDNALVRDGAGSQFYPVAQLQSGDQVLVTGLDESGEWFSVALPFDGYFGFNGKGAWMNFDLLRNDALEYDFDVTLFTGAAE